MGDFINERLDKKDVKIDNDYLTNIIKEHFEHCLAPDTMGDGTGCDNMTAVIVKFKPGFKSVQDCVSDPNNTTSGSSEVSENGLKRAGEEHENSEKGDDPSDEPSSKKVKLDLC